MATEANVIFGAGRDDSSMNSPNLHSDREIFTHGNIGLGSGVVGIIPNSQQNKNKFSRARSNDKGKYNYNAYGTNQNQETSNVSLSSIIMNTPRHTHSQHQDSILDSSVTSPEHMKQGHGRDISIGGHSGGNQMFSPINMDSDDQTKRLGYNSRQIISGKDEPMSEANMSAKLRF